MVKQIFKILKSLINKTSSFKTTRETVSECFAHGEQRETGKDGHYARE